MKKYLEDIILFVIKLLYNLGKAKNHWFAIYLDYYKKKLRIKILFYDIYLFITKICNKIFSIVRL